MIKTQLIGRIGNVRSFDTKTGKSLNCSVATNRKIAGKDQVTWTAVKLWGDRAAMFEPILESGQLVFVAGRAEPHLFEKNDGTAVAEIVLHADYIKILARAKDTKDVSPTVSEEEDETVE